MPTSLAGVFVDRYDVTLAQRYDFAVSCGLIHRYNGAVPVVRNTATHLV